MFGILGGLMGGVGGAIMGRIASARQAAGGGGGGGATEPAQTRTVAEVPPPLGQQKRQHNPLSGLLMDEEQPGQRPAEPFAGMPPRQMRV